MTQQTNSSLSNLKDGNELTITFPGRPFYEVRDEFGKRVCHCGAQKDADEKVMHNPGWSWNMFFWPSTPPNPVVDINAKRLELEKQLPPSDWTELNT